MMNFSTLKLARSASARDWLAASSGASAACKSRCESDW